MKKFVWKGPCGYNPTLNRNVSPGEQFVFEKEQAEILKRSNLIEEITVPKTKKKGDK